MPDVIKVFQGIDGNWRWNRKDCENGRTVATSGEHFYSKYNAKRAAESLFGIDFEGKDEIVIGTQTN